MVSTSSWWNLTAMRTHRYAFYSNENIQVYLSLTPANAFSHGSGKHPFLTATMTEAFNSGIQTVVRDGWLR